jgi:hypothetical protein
MAMSSDEVTRRTLERLRKFTESVEVGTDFRATRVRRSETPDGPLTTRESGTWSCGVFIPDTPASGKTSN